MMKDEEKKKTERQSCEDKYSRPYPSMEKREEEEEEDEDSSKSSICCLQGCLAATAVGFAFFVALPTGILLVVYASNKNDVPLICVGGVLVSLPLLMLIIVIVLCFNQRRLARLGKNRINSAEKRKQRLPSPASSSSSSSSTAPTTVSTTTMTTKCESGERKATGQTESGGGGDGGGGGGGEMMKSTVLETERF